jgi:hypothetical protein
VWNGFPRHPEECNDEGSLRQAQGSFAALRMTGIRSRQ